MDPDLYAVYISNQYASEVNLDDFTWLSGKSLIAESRADGPFLIKQTMALLDAMDIETESVIQYPSSSTILMAVKAGIGFALMPANMNLGVVPDDILAIPVQKKESIIENSMGWHRDTKNVAAQKFVELVKEMEGK